MSNNERGHWGSSIGFLLAAVGSAVGLGNLWGFPYKMGMNGGFAFLVVYLVLAVFIGRVFDVVDLVKDWIGVGLAAGITSVLNIKAKER